MVATLSDGPRLRLGALCALYLAQGVSWGFVTVALATRLVERGLSAEALGGLVALATLPFGVKWLWGPVVDRFGGAAMGRRRPWILMAQAMMVVSAAALLAVPEPAARVGVLSALVMSHNTFVALQDVAVDALAVDLLPEDERGRANGLMYGAKWLGTALGGAGLATLAGAVDLRAAMLAEIALLAAATVVPLALRERPGDAWLSLRGARRGGPRAGSLTQVMRELLRALSRGPALAGVGLAACSQLGAGALSPIATELFVRRLGWDAERYAQLAGGPGVLAGAAGAVAGGWLADRVGHRRGAAAITLVLGGSWIAFGLAVPLWSRAGFGAVMIVVGSALLAALAAALFAVFMDVCDRRLAATQFSAYMALLSLSAAAGGWLAGPLQTAFGVSGSYLAAGGFQLVVVLALLAATSPTRAR